MCAGAGCAAAAPLPASAKTTGIMLAMSIFIFVVRRFLQEADVIPHLSHSGNGKDKGSE
jgi:hypothetical protein